ncbi:MAG: HAMP domain-containing histidine kinase [Clostridiales bacterium]|nr:HAMP domain-containing histidine kinase [Clostridiales bacterium]
MIKRLRMKFALTAIGSVLLVLIVLVGGINIFNYREVVSDSDAVLRMLSDNGGMFPERRTPPQDRFDGENHLMGRDRIDSPELAFETRYFSAVIGIDGSVGKVDTGRIAAVSETEAGDYALEAVSSGKTRGFIGEYRFIVSPQTDGSMLVIFCDCGAGLANFRGFLRISVIISVISLVLISIAIFLISGRAVKPVAESYEKQKRFITDAGHEIKTPLAIINADADVLEMESGTDNEWIADIKKQTSRLTELTNDLIMLSRMEEGRDTLTFESLDLSGLVTGQADSFRAVAASSGKTIGTSVAAGIRTRGDKKAITELVSILLDNAVKYCPEGGSISVSLAKESHGSIIEIINDTADDMDPATLDQLFDRFYRGDSSRNSDKGGYGIGLSIAHAIVNSHKGKISVHKKEEGKIAFRVFLRDD